MEISKKPNYYEKKRTHVLLKLSISFYFMSLFYCSYCVNCYLSDFKSELFGDSLRKKSQKLHVSSPSTMTLLGNCILSLPTLQPEHSILFGCYLVRSRCSTIYIIICALPYQFALLTFIYYIFLKFFKTSPFSLNLLSLFILSNTLDRQSNLLFHIVTRSNETGAAYNPA